MIRLKRLRAEFLSPAMIVALVALIIAVAGTAWAAATIGSAQIVNSSIRSIDVHNNNLQGTDILTGSLTGSDIATGSVSGVDVADGGLTGTDVNEATLEDVDATTLQGNSASAFTSRTEMRTVSGASDLFEGPLTLLQEGDLTLKMECYNDGTNDIMDITAFANGIQTAMDAAAGTNIFFGTVADVDAILSTVSSPQGVPAIKSGRNEAGAIANDDGTQTLALLRGSSTFLFNYGTPVKDCRLSGVVALA